MLCCIILHYISIIKCATPLYLCEISTSFCMTRIMNHLFMINESNTYHYKTVTVYLNYNDQVQSFPKTAVHCSLSTAE